ncbi:hypothetical protein GCM10022631_11200 [Deinococcus rubellus]
MLFRVEVIFTALLPIVEGALPNADKVASDGDRVTALQQPDDLVGEFLIELGGASRSVLLCGNSDSPP